MLKTRVIPTLLYKDVGLVKGKSFDSWRRVGAALQAVRVHNMRDVDELIFLDINATKEKRGADLIVIQELAAQCFMPLTVGGGVRNVEDVRELLRAGADKISLNSAAVERPELIKELSQQYGAQCVVVSLDVRRGNKGNEIVTHAGTRPTGIDPVTFAKDAERLGAGEILLTSVERDGTMTGYDIELIAAVSQAVTIPVIAAGGAGKSEDFLAAIIEGGAAAVAAGAVFQFTELTPLDVRRYLHEHGVAVRV